MALLYEVTGYDRATGRLKVFYEVPAHRTASVKKIAGIAPSDDGLGSYPLTSDQVHEIARVLETSIAHPDCDFFLEPFEESEHAAG